MGERIGILTGGGDCPGLNAVIRAVTKDAIHQGLEVVGILDGFGGLVENRVRPLVVSDVSNIVAAGGTILGSSNTADPFAWPAGERGRDGGGYTDVSERCVRTMEAHGLGTLIVAGGDGTMSIAARLGGLGIRCIGLPKTIDNDLVGTEITFGFQTAVATATDALDRVHTTAASHHRVMVVEVMGRNAGWLALHAGLASGADIVLIPEIRFDPARVCEAIAARRRMGKRFSIVCVAEGAMAINGGPVFARAVADPGESRRLGGIGQVIAGEIEHRMGIETRCTILGHVQRGGAPVAGDRVLATQLGHRAMVLLREGRSDVMVAVRGGELTSVALSDVANRQRTVPRDHPLLAAARAVYIDFGG